MKLNMKMQIKLAVVVLSALWANLLASNVDIDCKKYLDFQAISNCCSKPNVDFQAYRQACGMHMQEGAPNLLSCLYDCIFNTSKSIINMQFQEDNARKMAEQIFGSNKDFVDAYVSGLRNCTELTSEIVRNTRLRSSGVERCSMLPMALVLCTVKKVFLNCPSASWMNSQTCEDARDYILKCECDVSKKGCKKHWFVSG